MVVPPMFEEFGINAGFVEELHARYQQSPQAVDQEWREFFDSRENGRPNGLTTNGVAHDVARTVTRSEAPPPATTTTNGNGAPSFRPQALPSEAREQVAAAAAVQGRVYQLLNAYRVRGHLFAHVDPLGQPPDAAPELDLANFGLSTGD